jgi:hypothetical protein
MFEQKTGRARLERTRPALFRKARIIPVRGGETEFTSTRLARFKTDASKQQTAALRG